MRPYLTNVDNILYGITEEEQQRLDRERESRERYARDLETGAPPPYAPAVGPVATDVPSEPSEGDGGAQVPLQANGGGHSELDMETATQEDHEDALDDMPPPSYDAGEALELFCATLGF